MAAPLGPRGLVILDRDGVINRDSREFIKSADEWVPLPERDEEFGVLTRHMAGFDPRDLAAAGVRPVATADDLARAREAVAGVSVAPEVTAYVVDLVRARLGDVGLA